MPPNNDTLAEDIYAPGSHLSVSAQTVVSKLQSESQEAIKRIRRNGFNKEDILAISNADKRELSIKKGISYDTFDEAAAGLQGAHEEKLRDKTVAPVYSFQYTGDDVDEVIAKLYERFSSVPDFKIVRKLALANEPVVIMVSWDNLGGIKSSTIKQVAEMQSIFARGYSPMSSWAANDPRYDDLSIAPTMDTTRESVQSLIPQVGQANGVIADFPSTVSKQNTINFARISHRYQEKNAPSFSLGVYDKINKNYPTWTEGVRIGGADDKAAIHPSDISVEDVRQSEDTLDQLARIADDILSPSYNTLTINATALQTEKSPQKKSWFGSLREKISSTIASFFTRFKK